MVDVPEGVQIAAIYAGLATTAIVVIGGPIVVPLVGMFVSRQNAKTAAMLATITAAVAKVETVAEKVETVAVTTGVAANKVTALAGKVDDVKRTLEATTDRRDQQMEAVVAKVEAVQVAVEKKADNGPINIKLDAIVKVQGQTHALIESKADSTVIDAKLDAIAKTATETHVLVDGQMGRVLDIGLKAARLLAKAEPTTENLADLAAAEKAKRDHEAKMKVIEAKNAATPEGKP